MTEVTTKENKAAEELNVQLLEMKSLIVKQGEQIEDYGATRETLAKKIDDQDKILFEVQQDLDESKKQRESLELKMNRPNQGVAAGQSKSFGQAIVESEGYKNKQRGQYNMTINIDGFDSKALVDSTPTSGGSLVFSDRITSEVFHDPNRPPVLRDFIPTVATTSNAIEYSQRVGFEVLYTILSAPAADAQPIITVASTSGFYPDQEITVGTEPGLVTILTVDTETQITLTADLTVAQLAAAAVTSDNFINTPEGQLKPEMFLSYQRQTANVVTIATTIDVTRQIWDDSALLQADADIQGRFALMTSEEKQVLYGDGTSGNILGLLADPLRLQYLQSSGPVTDTKIDAIRRAALQSSIVEYTPDVLLLNKIDRADIDLVKGDDKHYIWVDPGEGAGNTLWRIPIVESQVINVGTFMTGNMRLSSRIYDRQSMTLEAFPQNKDNAVKNMITLRFEERIALANLRPQAIVEGIFS